MSLLHIILALVIVGLILWLINNYIPMDPKIKRAINIIVIVVLAIWLLKALGVVAYLQGITV